MSSAPRLIYNHVVATICVKLTARSRAALANITDTLRRESDDPIRDISVSTAVRRAIEVYSDGLYRQSGRRTLRTETARASANTYANKKKKGTR